MTTVAFKAGILAADSRATEDDESAKSNCIKLWRIQSRVEPVKGDVLLACSGDEFAAVLFKEWLESGGDPQLHARGVTDEDNFDALVVHRSGIYNANRLCCLVKTIEAYWAHGSGRQGALVAMNMGASAVKAVREAARVDPFTGGRVVSMSLDDPKPRRARKKAK